MQGTTQGIETHAGKHRECRYMGVMGIHTGKHRECRYMVVVTVPLVQEGHPYIKLSPHRESNPHKDLNPCREMQLI